MVRRYCVGDLVFGLELYAPYSFMEYTAPVEERIRRAAAGVLDPVLPTRAGDDVPSRSFVRTKEDLPESYSRFSVDLSQYEPFRADDSASEVFRLCVLPAAPVPDSADGSLIFDVDDTLPSYSIFSRGEETLFRFRSSDGSCAAVLTISPDLADGKFTPVSRGTACLTGKSLAFYLNMALMVMYTYNASARGALLVHASVICHGGGAHLFLGRSGTGKSTHSRLWLENIEGSALLNDDNPVLRFSGGDLVVYGTPWSGKTPCYRNASRKVTSIVSLSQAPFNEIHPVKGIPAYSFLLSSVSSVRWNRKIMDRITAVLSETAMEVPCYKMSCLPDADAALTCCRAIESQEPTNTKS
ncbi:MAG: hypothetical protein ACI399_00735 [Candidatus Cryptobacteroides sp.]